MHGLNQSDRLNSAFKHHASQSGAPSPADSDQGGAKCCPPKRKAVIADHTLSYHEQMPDTQNIMLPNITH